MKDAKNDQEFIVKEFLDPKDALYKFHDLPQRDTKPSALLAQTYDQSKICHEWLRFELLKLESDGETERFY